MSSPTNSFIYISCVKIFSKLLFPTLLLFMCLTKTVQAQDSSSLVIQFENASTEITSGYTPLLYRLADSLITHPDIYVLIRGHVCCVKRNRLARRRAKTVYKKLIQFGVDKKHLKFRGYKNSIPVVFPEKTKEDELINMRVDFIFYNGEFPARFNTQ